MVNHYHRTYDVPKTTPFKIDRSLLRKLLLYFRPYRFYLVLAVLLLVMARLIEALVPILLGTLTTQVVDTLSIEYPVLLKASLGIFGLLGFGYLLDAISVVTKSWVGGRALHQLRTDVYQHFQKMPMSYYDHNAVGKMMTRTIHDVDQINQMFSESIIPLFSSLILFVSIVSAMFYVEWRVATVVVAIFPALGWLTHHFRVVQRRCYQKIRAIVSAMNGFVQEHLMGAATIRSFGLEKKEEEQFSEMNEDHCTAYQETIRHFAFFFAGIDFLHSLLLISIFVILTLTTPSFEAGMFFTFSLYALMVFRPLYEFAERYNVLQSAMAASERVFQSLDQKTETDDFDEGTVLSEIHTITFNDVWFAYKKEDWVLQSLSFSVNPGESLAFVGLTGAGKTSLFNLLMRFYEFQKGQITINGSDIRDYSLRSLREQFSNVLQDPVILSGSIKDNITLGNPTITQETLETVVDDVNLRDLLRRYPRGWDEPLQEQGKGLSVGEMQLIALARAVAQPHSVLMLDEATANIDSITEAVIQTALKKVLHAKTSLVIAHRLSTIKDVDKILVVHEGKIVEQGTHNTLLQQKGMYEKLYRLQF